MSDPTPVLYVVLHCDRHYDPNVFVHTNPDAAIAHAQDLANDYASRPETITEELTGPMRDIGWIYHCTYSTEDADWIAVVEREVIA